MRLDNTKIKILKDLMNAFINQYKFNMDIAPDRMNRQDMKMGDKEYISKDA
jgi:hypothetical protein